MQNNEHDEIAVAEDANWPMVVGVDLGGTQMRAGVLRGSQVLSRVNSLSGKHPTPQHVIPRVFDMVQQALAEAGVGLADIAGIGIAAPGPLDSRTGMVYDPPNMPEWTSVPLRDLFMERFHVPVYVENDANAACLGEFMFGAGRGTQQMVYLTISTGIGGGIILNGEIVEGASGTAGELGHMTIDRHGERCNCGNTGCLERIASGTAIALKANDSIRSSEGMELLTFARTMLQHSATVSDPTGLPITQAAGDTIALQFPPASSPVTQETQQTQPQEQPEDELEVTARTVALAAEAGVPVARAIIQDAAEGLGIGLVNIIHIFNPEVIVLGGGVTQMGPMLLEPALHVVQERTMKAPREVVRVVLAELGENAGLIGAGALNYYYAERGRDGGTEGTA